MIRKLLLPVLFLFAAVAARADLGWHTAYEHDASGTTVSGSATALVAAINAGADVKLLILNSSGNVTASVIPYIVEVLVTTNTVAARYREVSAELLANGNVQIQSAAYDIDAVVNSTGFVSYARYYKDGSKKSDSTFNWAVRWMVNY